MNPTSPVIPPPVLLLLMLLAAAPQLAPVDAASMSGSGTPSFSMSPSFTMSMSNSVSVTNSMSFSPSLTNSMSFSPSLTNSGSPSFSPSFTNSMTFSPSFTNSMSASKSTGATPPPQYVPGVATYGLPVTVAPTPGLGPKGQAIARCANGVKDRPEQCSYYIGGNKKNPCCTPTCQFRNSDHECVKKTPCMKAARCGARGVCDVPQPEPYRTECKINGVEGRCMQGKCVPGGHPRSPKKLRRLLERRLRKMRNQDLAARGLLPEQQQEEDYADEDFSAEEEYLADLNNNTDSRYP